MRALRALVAAVAKVATATALLIIAFAVAPGDPAAGIFGERALNGADAAALTIDGAAFAERLPRVLAAAVGDPPGYSLRYDGVPVIDIVFEGLPITLGLCVAALALAGPAAVAVGIAAATRGRGREAFAATIFTAFASAPAAALAAGLVYWLAVAWRLTPAAGWSEPTAAVIPVLTLAAPAFGLIGRAAWALAAETAPLPYVRTARAKGLSRYAAAWRHILPNIAAPLAATLALAFGWMLSGALVIETLFAIPGAGRETVRAIAARDYPTAIGCMAALAALNVGAGLLADWAAWRADWRAERREGRRDGGVLRRPTDS